jgi:MFS family permease
MTTRSSAKDVSQQNQRIFSFDWYRTLPEQAAHAFWASFMGWALDAFDFQVFSLALTAIAATFALSKGQSGLIATVTLVVSAIGGVAAGALADRIGRVRTLMVTIAVYAIFTFLSGLAPNYGLLLTFRALQGLGFGGEWAAGAILVAEVANPVQRGRVLGMVQSAWAIGWGLAVLTLPRRECGGFLVQRGNLPLYPHRYSSRGYLSPSVRTSCLVPVPVCPTVRQRVF